MCGVKIGLFLSVTEGSAGDRWQHLKHAAQHDEATAFDPIWVAHHSMIPDGGPAERPIRRCECWSIPTELATITSRVELGTLVVCAGFRNPALLARMADLRTPRLPSRSRWIVSGGSPPPIWLVNHEPL